MWAMLAKALAGTILEGLLQWLGERINLKRMVEAEIGRAVAEQREADALEQARIQKEMADAQARAPRDRRELADRLRAEANAPPDPAASAQNRVPFVGSGWPQG